VLVAAIVFVGATPALAVADSFDRYVPAGSFDLPAGSTGMDVLADGRAIALSADAVFVETDAGTRVFNSLGTLPGADIASFGVAFVAASPDSMRIAVGNNGGASGANYRVGVFDVPALTGVWFRAEHFDGAWYDDTLLALASGDFATGEVSVLDTLSPDPSAPVNVTVLGGIGGASGGVAFDNAGNLYAGNGFMSGGPSGTGAVKAFQAMAWQTALSGGAAIDFEAAGTLVVDILSAASLGFDPEGNLHVSGADHDVSKFDFAALVHHDNIRSALGGGPPADILDGGQVRRFDPDAGDDFNFYSIQANELTRELLIRSFGETTVYVYEDPAAPVPAASAWGLATMLLLGLIVGTITFRRGRDAHSGLGVTVPGARAGGGLGA